MAQLNDLLITGKTRALNPINGSCTNGTTVTTQTQSTKFMREDGTWSAPSYMTIGTTSTTAMAGDTDVNNVTQTKTTTNSDYEILFSGTADNTTRAEGARKTSTLLFNPSKTALTIGARKSNSTIGSYSVAEGVYGTASSMCSHVEGVYTTASGDYSHAEGYYTTAQRRSQHVFGEYNILDTEGSSTSSKGNYIEIVGNGTSPSVLSNARTLDWSGNEVLSGTLTCTDVTALNTTWDGTNTSLITAVTNKLDKSGGTITGNLTVNNITNCNSIVPRTSNSGLVGSQTYPYNESYVNSIYTKGWCVTTAYSGTSSSLMVASNSDIYFSTSGSGGTLNTWDGTNTSLKTAISSIPKVKVADYTFTFPSTATAYYEHYYYDVTYSNLNIPTTGVKIINAFVANVQTNIPAFAQCVTPSAFRVNSKYADIKGKTITMRVIYI